MDIRKEAELRVLRHLVEKKDEMIPDGMEGHEYKCTAEPTPLCTRGEIIRCLSRTDTYYYLEL